MVDYNNSEVFIDLSLQILLNGIRWYQNLAVELLLESPVVGSYIMYKDVTQNDLSVTEFWEKFISQLLPMDEEYQTDPRNEVHLLEEVL
jgi:hypothetical protein